MRPVPTPVFYRRSFIFFILVAPVCLLAVAGIVVTLQYKQFRAVISPASAVEGFAWTAAARQSADTILASLHAFSENNGPDTLRLSPADLTLLAAASPAAERQGIRFRIAAADSQLIVESAQRVDALNGRLAWIFKRLSPAPDGWLNARMEGLPEWKAGNLAFAPVRGFLNGTNVPRAAMTKRGGLSPKDFLDPAREPEYSAFLRALDTVLLTEDGVVLIRKESRNQK